MLFLQRLLQADTLGLLKEQLVAQTFCFLALKWAARGSLPLPVLQSDGYLPAHGVCCNSTHSGSMQVLSHGEDGSSKTKPNQNPSPNKLGELFRFSSDS